MYGSDVAPTEDAERSGRRASSATAGSQIELRGVVRYLDFSSAPRAFGPEAQDRLTFHLYDPAAHGSSGSAYVQMDSNRLAELTIREGDEVVVRGQRSGQGPLYATAVRDLTTHTALDLEATHTMARLLRAPLSVLWFASIPAAIMAVIAIVCSELRTAALLGVPALVVWAAHWAVSRQLRRT